MAEKVHVRFLGLSAPYSVAVTLVVIVGAVLTIRGLSSNFLAHDDGITMLGVTCNQGRYADGIPTEQWVQAGAWQDYWRLGTPGCFGQIRSDMANFDIHPPLYFWVLHVWFLAFGVSIPAALMLNTAFIAITGALMLATCRLLSVPAVMGVAAVVTWALTMSTRAAGAAIRPYALLGLFAALVLFLVVLWLRRNRFGYLVALVPVVAGGMLTQFLFVVPAGMVFILIGATLISRREYRGVAELFGVYALAAVAFVVIDPGFMGSINRGGEQAQSFTWVAVPVRGAGVLAAVFETFVPLDPAYQIDATSIAGWLITIVVMIPVLTLAVRWLWRNRRNLRSITVDGESTPLVLFVGCWLAVVALFLLFVSPQHSMRPIYLYFLTPFFFVALAIAARRSAAVVTAISALLVYQLIGVTIATAGFVYAQRQGETLVPVSNAAIVLDSDRRGIVPAALWPVDHTVPTYAATQDQLLERFPDLSGTASHELYYISKVMFGDTYGNTTAKRDSILKQFADRGYAIDHLGMSASMGGAEVYRLTRRR